MKIKLFIFISLVIFLSSCSIERTRTYEIEINFCDDRPPMYETIKDYRRPSNNDIITHGQELPAYSSCDCSSNHFKYINVCDIEVIKEY